MTGNMKFDDGQYVPSTTLITLVKSLGYTSWHCSNENVTRVFD